MERITRRWGCDHPLLAGRAVCEFHECPSGGDCKTCNHAKVNNRLADYEDTGLNPEEIIELRGGHSPMISEEVFSRLKNLKARCERLIASGNRDPEEWWKDAEAISLALSALRCATEDMVKGGDGL